MPDSPPPRHAATHPPLPRVGVGVFVLRGGRVLLGERLGSHGAGTWALPGGHLDFGETIADCARREVSEETGLRIGAVRHAGFTEDFFPGEGRHYVTLFVVADGGEGEPVNREPDRCGGWHWFPPAALPAPLFPPLASLLAQGFVVPAR